MADIRRLVQNWTVIVFTIFAVCQAQAPPQWTDTGFPQAGCVLESDPGNQAMYQVYVPNRGYMSFSCAPGTVFFNERCGCDWPTVQPEDCQGDTVRSCSAALCPHYSPKDRKACCGTCAARVTTARPATTPRPAVSTGPGGPFQTRPPGGGPPITPRPPQTRPPISWTTRSPPWTGGQMPWTTPEPIGPTTKAPCTFRPDMDRHFYEQYIYGFGWQKRRCPMGTMYNHTVCACHDLAPVMSRECNPEMWLNFDHKKVQDDAGSNIPVGNNGNVASVSNSGRFDGTGTLTIWRYANTDFGQLLTINFRFYDFPGGNEEQILVSNCYVRDAGSVEIALNQVSKEVIFRGDTVLSPPAEIRLPYQEKAWKNVTFIYDGTYMRGRVDNQEKTAPMKGNLDTRYNGLLIGNCNGRGFVGYIDDLRLYRCVKHDIVAPNLNTGFEFPTIGQ